MLSRVGFMVGLLKGTYFSNHSNLMIHAYISKAAYIQIASLDTLILIKINCMISTMLIEVTNLSALCWTFRLFLIIDFHILLSSSFLFPVLYISSWTVRNLIRLFLTILIVIGILLLLAQYISFSTFKIIKDGKLFSWLI